MRKELAAPSTPVPLDALANGLMAHKDVSAKTRRNVPDPIPVMVLARLAVDSAYQKQGLGSALLKDALLRTIAAAEIAGIRAMLLHAMSDDAKRFHARAGVYECPVDPMMMMITLAEVENLGPLLRRGCRNSYPPRGFESADRLARPSETLAVRFCIG